MADFHNNLRTGDKVFDVELKRSGLVHVASEHKRLVKVIFDGNKNAKTCDVTTLRFVVDGKPEEVAPFDGELIPATSVPRRTPAAGHPAVRLVSVTPLESLQAKRDANNARRDAIQKEFLALGEENQKLENAIAALKA